MFVFCMQHGMLWVGNPILPEQHEGVPELEAANRLGSWSGLMAQSRHGAPADAFSPGDEDRPDVWPPLRPDPAAPGQRPACGGGGVMARLPPSLRRCCSASSCRA